MAILKSDYLTRDKMLPSVTRAGELSEVTIKIDTTKQNLAVGDLVQLMQVPSGCVVSDIKMGVNATFGATTAECGIATNSTDATLQTVFIAATTLTDTSIKNANSLILADKAVSDVTDDDRIVAVKIGAEAETTNKLYIAITFRSES